ncbi:MAG: DNA replication/repair protein RecF [Pseudomonadota bacterium]
MLRTLQIQNFRCLEAVSLELATNCSVVTGENGAGKTSLLEAVFTLSRGRSFRSSRRDAVVRHGTQAATIFGLIESEHLTHRVGLEIGRSERRIRINGEDRPSIGEVTQLLPVQLIDPTVHTLIEGGPDRRRQFIDFGVFHVERRFMETWSQYRRAVSQRNSALRAMSADAELDTWDASVASLAETLTEQRQTGLALLDQHWPSLMELVLPDTEVALTFKRGWREDVSLLDLLRQHRARDRDSGLTGDGAHRADLRIDFRSRVARHQVSRGQQKLLASALVLAQVAAIQAQTGQQSVVMLDDPAAELDTKNLDRLLGLVFDIPCQRIVTALDATRLQLPTDAPVFHVEHGQIR